MGLQYLRNICDILIIVQYLYNKNNNDTFIALRENKRYM